MQLGLAAALEDAIAKCKQETALRGAKYFGAADSSSPTKPGAKAGGSMRRSGAGPTIRYPDKLPPSEKQLMDKVSGTLSVLQEQLQAHLEAAVKELRSQVIRAYQLLEKAPSAALNMLLLADTTKTKAEHEQKRGAFEAEHKQLLDTLLGHRRQLQPSMAQPQRADDLEDLQLRESQRGSAYTQMLPRYAAAVAQAALVQGPRMRMRLVKLAELLLKLLDATVMPLDLPPIGEPDAWVYDLEHKDTKRLQRLHMAVAEAKPAVEAPEAGGKSPKKGAGKGSPALKTSASGKRGESPAIQARPFTPTQWLLEAGQLNPVAMGWTLGGLTPLPDPHIKLPAGEEGRPGSGRTNRSPSPGARPGSKDKSGKGSPSSPKGRPRSGSKQRSASASSIPELPLSQALDMSKLVLPNADKLVTGLDTPCQRAVVRTFRACLQQEQEVLQAALMAAQQRIQGWQGEQEVWTQTWNTLLQQISMLKL